MSPSTVSFLAEFAVLVRPINQTLVYWLWYSALLWIPVRIVAAMIDRRRNRVEQVAQEVPADENYRVGMPILPPL
jgi:hypothetical protein